MKRMADKKKDTFITGLDIGSSKISAVMSEIGREGGFRVVAHVTMPSKGMARGAFFDLNESVDMVSKVLSSLRSRTGRRPSGIYVNITGESVKGSRSRGMIPLALRGREITNADIDRCIDVASTVHLPFDREIIHKVVQNFSVDDQPWIKSPLGLYASRLSSEVYIITASVNHIQNLYKCVNNAGYDVKEVVFTGIADGAALLDPAEREEGVLLLDMGATTTTVAGFCGGGVADIDTVPIGSEDMKGAFKDNDSFKILAGRIKGKIKDMVSAGAAVKGVTITGGMAFEDGIAEALEEYIAYRVKMGLVKDVKGDISGLDRLRLATAIGLCRYAYEKHEKKAREDRDIVKRLTTKVVDLFNSYF